MSLVLTARHERWPIAKAFRISRGSKAFADVVVVTASDDGLSGWGECVPYAHYGETVEQTMAGIESLGEALAGRNLNDAEFTLPPGAAGNGVDCALWDLMAQLRGTEVWGLLELPVPEPQQTAYTITLESVDEMALQAAAVEHLPLLKLKLGEGDVVRDMDRMRAVSDAAPDSDLIVDVNEGWSFDDLKKAAPVAADAGIKLIEQPLPADADEVLSDYSSPVALGADESVHGVDDLARLRERYQVVNVKLDKAGGLSRAQVLIDTAVEQGFEIMIGCMVGTSLSMAPALLLAHGARFVDLDGPVLLAEDRSPGLAYDLEQGVVSWGVEPFWGEVR